MQVPYTLLSPQVILLAAWKDKESISFGLWEWDMQLLLIAPGQKDPNASLK